MGEALPFMSSPSLRQGPSSTLEMSLWVKSRQTAPSQNAALSGYKNRHSHCCSLRGDHAMSGVAAAAYMEPADS